MDGAAARYTLLDSCCCAVAYPSAWLCPPQRTGHCPGPGYSGRPSQGRGPPTRLTRGLPPEVESLELIGPINQLSADTSKTGSLPVLRPSWCCLIGGKQWRTSTKTRGTQRTAPRGARRAASQPAQLPKYHMLLSRRPMGQARQCEQLSPSPWEDRATRRPDRAWPCRATDKPLIARGLPSHRQALDPNVAGPGPRGRPSGRSCHSPPGPARADSCLGVLHHRPS